MVKARREQRTEETRQALINAGRTLFGRRGFAATSAREIVTRARVTRGALYHHFPTGKRGLFEAVARELQVGAVDAMVTAARNANDPWAAMNAAINGYFEFANRKAYRQITLHDAPSVIGATSWRKIEYEYSMKFIERGLGGLIQSGEIRPVPLDMLASAVFGACCELTLTIAAAEDAEKAKKEAADTVVALVRGLRA